MNAVAIPFNSSKKKGWLQQQQRRKAKRKKRAKTQSDRIEAKQTNKKQCLAEWTERDEIKENLFIRP